TTAADSDAGGVEESGPRTVEHAMGSTEVPATVERVVVLDSSMLDSAVALGVVPVGATEGLAGSGLPKYLGDEVLDEVELVGLTETPNLEAVAALQPDLIIGAKVRHEGIYDQLSQIAPTVFSESSGTDWKSQVRLTGEALGLADDAEALLTEFDERAAEVGESIGAEGTTATIVRFIPGQIRLYGPKTFSGSVLEAVGFDLGDKGYDPAYGMAVISAEQIDMVDADVVFATNPAEESDGQVQSDRESLGSRWDNLSAVQQGRQFDIADMTWMTGIGVLGANRILDDLEEQLG
ncbi:MAG: iron-siderophore ABC transporter substrate-binding protein, partial [Actinomycetota bacterium]|nr:iron-siderophore ABC transporter substrate-binding protein [Actinomycetota bacterium]